MRKISSENKKKKVFTQEERRKTINESRCKRPAVKISSIFLPRLTRFLRLRCRKIFFYFTISRVGLTSSQLSVHRHIDGLILETKCQIYLKQLVMCWLWKAETENVGEGEEEDRKCEWTWATQFSYFFSPEHIRTPWQWCGKRES